MIGFYLKVENIAQYFHNIFTDHSVVFQRFRCRSCGYELPYTVKQALGTIRSAEVHKIQSTLDTIHTVNLPAMINTIFF